VLPDNDVLRFFLVLIGMLLVFTIIFRLIDGLIEVKKMKYRDEELFDEMKEALNDNKDDPPRS
jgi:DNA-binding MltR family transcriptional regulator